MICPNCGYQQTDGRVCVECNAIIDPVQNQERAEGGSTIWAEEVPEEVQEESPVRNAGKTPPRADGRSRSHPKEGKAKAVRDGGTADRIVKIVLTTSATVQGRVIVAYKGPVTSASIVKIDVWDPFLAAVKEVSGLRNAPINESLRKAQRVALSDMKIEAAKLEADAVIGTTIRFEVLNSKVMLVYVTGTAVVFRPEVDNDGE
jgi:uncharacterized protein YbjQ (UPF0145 family)